MRSTMFMGETLNKVDAVVDVGQVGLIQDSRLYVHTLRNESGGYERYFRAAAAASADLNISFEYPEPDPDRGVPPSSALAFEEASISEKEQEQKHELPIFVLADHEDTFHNKHYMSHRDRTIAKDSLCGTATLLTRVLYRLAAGIGDDKEKGNSSSSSSSSSSSDNENNLFSTGKEEEEEIEVDCALVEELAGCLIENFKCPIAENFFGNMTTSDGSEVIQISKYTGIFGSKGHSFVVGTIQRFVRLFTLRYAPMDIAETNCTVTYDCPTGYQCIGNNGNGTCVRGITEYHNALSVGVQYDDGEWKVTDKTQPLWAES